MTTTRVRPRVKDPDEVLDYEWNWGARRLVEGETIQTSVTLVSPPGLGVDSTTHDTTRAVVRVSGGTSGTSYRVTNRVTTSQGRVYDWTIIITVRPR